MQEQEGTQNGLSEIQRHVPFLSLSLGGGLGLGRLSIQAGQMEGRKEDCH